MKITFEDSSYIEFNKTLDGKIIISIQAKDYQNPLKRITNSVELSQEQFLEAINGIDK